MKTVSLALVLSSFVFGAAWAEEPVYFPDPTLKEAVESDLWISDPTPTDMLGLIDLRWVPDFFAQDGRITDLTGLEHATNLQTLNLRLNGISGISTLSALTNLERLDLSQNQISDLSPLSGLTRLYYLNLHENQISDLSPLSGLSDMQTLILRFNQVSDISALSSLTNLGELELGGNEISDIPALSGLTQLSDVCLWKNQISDISPLSGLTSLYELDLRWNQVSDISALSGLDNLRHLDLESNQISDISPLSGLTNLRELDLGGNQISDISALSGLTNLKTLNLERNYALDNEAYCTHLETMHNRGAIVTYTPNNRPATGVRASDDVYQDKIRVTWDKVCNGPDYTSYYKLFRALSEFDTVMPISQWQTSLGFDDTTAEPGTRYVYWVQTAVPSDGFCAGDYSAWAAGRRRSGHKLTLSSASGGSVTTPGEGTHVYGVGETVDVEADPIDSNLYFFAGWTGTAVDARKVADCSEASTVVTVDDDYTLKAHFVTVMNTIYVDDDAEGDPKPGDSNVSDPNENGTPEHPFDRIQEAIEVAPEGASVVVRPGTYREDVSLLGKSIQLLGTDPDNPNGVADVVIDGDGTGPVVSFTASEDPNCTMIGFVITRGQGRPGGAITCSGSSPTLANCLIVGNHSTDPNGAAVYCTDSDAIFINCTIADNVDGEQGAGIALVDSHVALINSIVWDNTANEILLRGASEPSISYTDIGGGWPGPGNIDTDPLFAQVGHWVDRDDPGVPAESNDHNAVWIEGDYHLKSQTGRWDPVGKTWVQDETTSPCIDGGSPASPVGYEPAPNGGIVNMGTYGGTAQAGKSGVYP